MSFRIGTDEANEIDVILVHLNFPFVARISRGTRKSEVAVPKPQRELFWKGTQTRFGEGVQTRQGAQQEFDRRAQGAGITRSECPVEMGMEGKSLDQLPIGNGFNYPRSETT